MLRKLLVLIGGLHKWDNTVEALHRRRWIRIHGGGGSNSDEGGSAAPGRGKQLTRVKKLREIRFKTQKKKKRWIDWCDLIAKRVADVRIWVALSGLSVISSTCRVWITVDHFHFYRQNLPSPSDHDQQRQRININHAHTCLFNNVNFLV